jgi:hypothetical protein
MQLTAADCISADMPVTLAVAIDWNRDEGNASRRTAGRMGSNRQVISNSGVFEPILCQSGSL